MRYYIDLTNMKLAQYSRLDKLLRQIVNYDYYARDLQMVQVNNSSNDSLLLEVDMSEEEMYELKSMVDDLTLVTKE